MIKKISFFLCLAFFGIYANAQQKGTVSGTLHDGQTNDVLPFADVFVKNSEKGTTSDFDGDYELKLKPGTYTIVFSFVGYQKKEINQVVVRSGKVFNLDVTLKPSAGQLDEVVISTTARRNTEKAVLNLQKNSVIQMDGLSLQTIKQSGASTIAAAVKSVPGVSVQSGKYVFVRGLGDRYTKSILNGMDIPGLNPDKNSIQLDIFPTNILENILVTKTASADLPADFTGGIVNIVTKDFPSKRQLGVSVSAGYNPDMNFKDNYLTYDGGGTDFLGFDDGTREQPVSSKSTIPKPATDDGSLEGITRSFTKTLGAEPQTSLPNFSFGANYGNQYDVGDDKLGVIASIDYKNKTTFYEGFKDGIYQKPEANDEYELRADRTETGNLGMNNVLISGLVGLSYKTGRSKYKLNVLRIQNGESRAALFDGESFVTNASRSVVKHNLEYTQRSITNLLLSGKHSNKDASFTTTWKIAPTLARSNDKDVRLTTFIKRPDGGFTISSDAGFPNRIWRHLKETDLVGKVDFAKKYKLFGQNAKFKFGGLYSYKKRDYGIDDYKIRFYNVNTAIYEGNPNALLASDNIYTQESNSGSYISGDFDPANNFEAQQNTAALYVSNEFRFSEDFQAVIGLRAEQFTSYFTGQNSIGNEVYDNEKTIDEVDFFPSANLIYNFSDKTKIRLSYSRTTARPTFKELSVVQISDLLTGRVFLGNINLKPSYIDNLDFKVEFYGDEAQTYSLSSFYKKFKDPIELVAYSSQTPNQFTPRNAPSAEVYGLEFEARKNFGFISEGLKKLSLRVNASVIESQIKMGKGPDEEYQSRLRFARKGQEIEDTRKLQGQSPYLINVGLNYDQSKIGLKTGLFYNVQGKTLKVVGLAQNPDVYAQPFNSLDFSLSKTIGKHKRSKISFKVENILGDDNEQLYESFGAADQPFRLRSPGREFSLGYSLKL